MLVSLTVGKVDAGVAVLLTEDKRLIEFPSILLPSSIQSGSIVDITVAQNHKAEQQSQEHFSALQERILDSYGLHAPTPPVLRLRNATQTSIVLEWDPIQLASSKLRSLALFRDGSKAGNIPRPLDMLSTKISGLSLDKEYSFYLVLRTSGGTFQSNVLTVKTHTMTNLTGITITPGILPPQLRESLENAVERVGAKMVDSVRIDTTHFICTEGRGRDWEKAVEMSIPVVRPEWIEGCEREGKIVGVRAYYLDADPKQRIVGSNPSMSRPAVPMSPPVGNQSQGNLPPRSNPKSPNPAAVPGSDVPPTPPPKKELPPQPEATGDEEESGDEPEVADDHEEQPNPQSQSGAAEHQSDYETKTAIKDDLAKQERSEGGDMEEVAL